jgi:adenosylhomocysteine nucleosidase
MPEIAMVAALERELAPLLKGWHATDREFSGRRFRFFESGNQVAVCGGIGREAARRASEAVISLYQPVTVLSVGFAGGLDSSMRVGAVFEPRNVVDAGDSSRVDIGSGQGTLVSFSSVAGTAQKASLAQAYDAMAVDMEAASVAKSAEAHGLRFAAIKVISDEVGFRMPPMEQFIGKDGEFQSGSFALYAGLRPWIWPSVIRLARNSVTASRVLCRHLEQLNRSDGKAATSSLAMEGEHKSR